MCGSSGLCGGGVSVVRVGLDIRVIDRLRNDGILSLVGWHCGYVGDVSSHSSGGAGGSWRNCSRLTVNI